jgi:hypothetical protein
MDLSTDGAMDFAPSRLIGCAPNRSARSVRASRTDRFIDP